MPVHHNALIQWNLVDSGTITVILANEEKGCYGTVSKKVKIKNCTDTKEKGFEQDIFKFSPFDIVCPDQPNTSYMLYINFTITKLQLVKEFNSNKYLRNCQFFGGV